MIARKTPSRLAEVLRAAVPVFLLSTASLARAASVREVRLERVGRPAPAGGLGAAAPFGVALPVAGAVLGSGPAPLAAPSADLGAVAPAAIAASVVPASAEPSPSSARPDREGGPDGEGPVAAPRDRSAAVVSRFAGLARGSAAVATPESRRSVEGDRAEAQREFSALLGERLAQGESGAARDEALRQSSERRESPRRLAASSRAGLRLLSGVPAAALFLYPAVSAAVHPSLAVWHALSQAGYVAGNVGASIFPLVQIHATFHGKPTPKWRAIVGAAASLALGLVCAPILGNTLWGVQNVFGGLTLLVPLLIGGFARRARVGGLKETALIAAAALAASVAAYFAVASVLPAFLAASLSAAAIAKVALVVQTATSVMFLGMFLPDVVKVLRGKAADGFVPGFNLLFFLSTASYLVWAFPAAWLGADANRGTYRMIFVVNAVYALASFLSFRFARREARRG